MLSTLTGQSIGAKWKPIRTTTGTNRKKDPNETSEKVSSFFFNSVCEPQR
jgi:hypothetical protein